MIELTGRKMRYVPWGEARTQKSDIFAASGVAVAETLAYFSQCGGDAEALIGLLNDHLADERYRISLDDLQNPSAWYSHEFYFYFIWFGKLVIGREDFRFGEGSTEQLSEYHKIYELGRQTMPPWGVDAEGKEIRDVSMATLIAITLEFDAQLMKHFLQLLNATLPDGYSLDHSMLNNELIWCSFQFVEYGFELAFVCQPQDMILTSVYSAVLYRIRTPRLLKAVPKDVFLKSFDRFIETANNVHHVDYHYSSENSFHIAMTIKKPYPAFSEFNSYSLSCRKNDAILWTAAASGLLSLMHNFASPPKSVITYGDDGKYAFHADFKWPAVFTQQRYLTTEIIAIISVSGIGIITPLFPLPYSSVILFFMCGCAAVFFFRTRFLSRIIKKISIDAQEQAKVSIEQLEELKTTTADLMRERSLLEHRVAERTAELQAANAQLYELNRARTAFFANMSHELKTPITLIKTPLEELTRGGYGQHVAVDHPNLLTACRNADRLLHLVSSILRGLELENSTAFTEVAPIDLERSLRLHIAEFQALAKPKNVRFALELSARFTIVKANLEGLEIIMANLLSNAVKFAPADSVITLDVDEIPNDLLRLRVADQGPGIAMEERERLFQRFKRVYDRERRDYEGTGLGLSISRELALRVGGDLRLDDAPPPGACFILELPRGTAVPSNPARVAFSASPQPLVAGVPLPAANADDDAPPSPTPATILIVEDNPDLRLFLEQSLARRYAVITAKDGLEGLEMTRRYKNIDLVVSDIMMPRLDGFSFIEAARSTRPALPCLFLTARDIPSERLQGLGTGAIDYICKPFSMPELEAKISAVITLSRHTRQSAKQEIEDRILTAISGVDNRLPLKVRLDGYGMSEREKDVAALLTEGLANKAIAARLDLSTQRVANICSDLFKKTGTASRVELIKLLG